MKQVFVSYVFEDRAHRDQVEQWSKEGRLGPVRIVGEQQDMRQSGEFAIRSHLAPLLKGAASLVLLVGDNSHNHEWVKYEVEAMLSAGRPVILARIPGTRGAPPASVQRLQEVALTPQSLREALG